VRAPRKHAKRYLRPTDSCCTNPKPQRNLWHLAELHSTTRTSLAHSGAAQHLPPPPLRGRARVCLADWLADAPSAPLEARLVCRHCRSVLDEADRRFVSCAVHCSMLRCNIPTMSALLQGTAMRSLYEPAFTAGSVAWS